MDEQTERDRMVEENARLRRALASSSVMPESEVELAKDLFTPEIHAGKYGRYIAKNLGIGNYTEDEGRVLLIYQSLIDTAVNEGLNREPFDLAGFYEAKKMAYASVSTASKGGFLLTNLRTSRGISEITSQDNTPQQKGQQGGIAKLRPQNPQQPGYY
jgi:hypothetical protein